MAARSKRSAKSLLFLCQLVKLGANVSNISSKMLDVLDKCGTVVCGKVPTISFNMDECWINLGQSALPSNMHPTFDNMN